MGGQGKASLVEDEILDHFEAEPLARFILQTGRTMLAQFCDQCFYEVDHRTNLWVESKNRQKLMTLSRLFYVKKLKKIKSLFELNKGAFHRSPSIKEYSNKERKRRYVFSI